jgi:hypothetical protein
VGVSILTTTSATSKDIPYEKKVVVKNLYISNIAEEFIAMRVDLEIPLVISILKELDDTKALRMRKNVINIECRRNTRRT